jgi:FlgD Ig-like domain
MKARGTSKLSDARLKALLKGLREDVAAPQDFRAKVLASLRAEGLIRAMPGPAFGAAPRPRVPVSLALRRVAAWMVRRPQWSLGGLALGSALALVFMFLAAPSPQVPGAAFVPAQPPAASTSKYSAAIASQAQAQNQASVLAMARPGAPAPASPPSPVSPLSGAGSGALAPASVESPQAVGGLESSAPKQALAVSAGGSQGAGPMDFADRSGKTAAAAEASSASAPELSPATKPTVVVATPTPLAAPLHQNSEVRANIIRASRGDSAIVLFTVTKSGPVLVEIHDRMGHSVAILQNGSLDAGQYTLTWNGTADEGGMAASGIYEVRIQTTTYVERHKMLLVK